MVSRSKHRIQRTKFASFKSAEILIKKAASNAPNLKKVPNLKIALIIKCRILPYYQLIWWFSFHISTSFLFKRQLGKKAMVISPKKLSCSNIPSINLALSCLLRYHILYAQKYFGTIEKVQIGLLDSVLRQCRIFLEKNLLYCQHEKAVDDFNENNFSFFEFHFWHQMALTH